MSTPTSSNPAEETLKAPAIPAKTTPPLVSPTNAKVAGQKANALTHLEELKLVLKGAKNTKLDNKIKELETSLQSEDKAVVSVAIEEALKLTVNSVV